MHALVCALLRAFMRVFGRVGACVILACVRARVGVCVVARVGAFVHAFVCACVHVCVHVCVHAFVCACMRFCVGLCVRLCVHSFVRLFWNSSQAEYIQRDRQRILVMHFSGVDKYQREFRNYCTYHIQLSRGTDSLVVEFRAADCESGVLIRMMTFISQDPAD